MRLFASSASFPRTASGPTPEAVAVSVAPAADGAPEGFGSGLRPETSSPPPTSAAPGGGPSSPGAFAASSAVETASSSFLAVSVVGSAGAGAAAALLFGDIPRSKVLLSSIAVRFLGPFSLVFCKNVFFAI